jgi:putative ABC transport system permease protein
VRETTLEHESKPTIYWPLAREPYPFMNLVLRSAIEPMRLAPTIEKEIRRMDPDQPVADVRTLDAIVAKAIARPRFDTFLLGIFAIVALVLASVGLYGVMNYSAMQRTHEIGIRMALGASRCQIMRLVLGDGMLLTFIGILLGLAGSVALTRVIESFLFGVSSTDVLTFVGVSLLLGAVSLLAAYVPARKATRLDPTVALRCE